jgi:hypothetical protein
MPSSSAIRHFLSVALPPLLLSAVAAVGIYWACGWSLGTFIGGLLITTALVPPGTLASDTLRNQLLSLTLTVTPIIVLWLVATCQTETLFREWLGCTAVLITYGLALAGLSATFRTLRLSATVSAAITIALALAWLTWPIWLSRTWDGESSAPAIARWAALHPALVIKIPNLGAWPEQSIAYHLTDLNQNVSYNAPPTVWTCVLTHGVLGALLLGFATWLPARPARRARNPELVEGDEPDPFMPGPDRQNA